MAKKNSNWKSVENIEIYDMDTGSILRIYECKTCGKMIYIPTKKKMDLECPACVLNYWKEQCESPEVQDTIVKEVK